jgi:enamine deaminase RidA (YjgF/YER057c/UK114 family)
VGDRVFVAGTAATMPDGADPPSDAYGQARRCLEIIATALAEAGGSLEDVVRTRAYLTDAAHFDGFAKAHGEAFATIRPANTTVVAQLLDPRWRVEIEAEAVLRSPE